MGNSTSGNQRAATTGRNRTVAPAPRRGLGARLRAALQNLRGRLSNR